jgi:hypothetical protein
MKICQGGIYVCKYQTLAFPPKVSENMGLPALKGKGKEKKKEIVILTTTENAACSNSTAAPPTV